MKKKQLTLTKNVMGAILGPSVLYRYAMTHLDDLVWLLEPAQNHIDLKSFKGEVRSLVKQMVKERRLAQKASDRLQKLIQKA